VTPAVPPPWIGDFCLMFCAPESIVSRADTPVARWRIVTSAGNGSRRYFQLASGRTSAWFAVRAVLQLKSGIGWLHMSVIPLRTMLGAASAAGAELVRLVLHGLRAVDTAVCSHFLFLR